MLATMTSKGQVTLPKQLRETLKLEPGSKLDFTLQDDGSIRLRAVSSDPLAIVGILPPPKRKRVTDAEIRAAIAQRAVQRFKRSTR